MASKAAKLCRVCMAFLIALMASDLLFASQKIAKPLQKWEDQVTQAGFAVIFQDFFRLFSAFFGFTINLNCQKPFHIFSHSRKPIVSGFNRSEGFDNSFLMKAPACSPIMSARLSFPSWRSWTLENGILSLLQERLSRRPKRMLQLQRCKLWNWRHRPRISHHFHHFRPGTFVVGFNLMNVKMGSSWNFLGPKRRILIAYAKEANAKLKVINEKEKHFVVTVAGAEKRFMKATYMLQELLAKFPKSKRPKASLVLDWLMPIKHRPNIAMDSFHLKKMMACMALHLMLVFPCTWYQCIYRTSTVLLESAQHAFWPTLLPGAWEHVSSCRDWGAKRLLQTLLPKIWLSLLVVCQSMSWQVAAEFYKMCSGDTASICKLFVLGCLGFAVLQWPCMSEKTKSCHFFLKQVLERCAQSNLFCHWFCKTVCSEKLHVDRSQCSTPYSMFILNIKT